MKSKPNRYDKPSDENRAVIDELLRRMFAQAKAQFGNNEIIATNDLTVAEDQKTEVEFEVFKGIEWSEEWETYDFNNGKIVMKMWVNPRKDTVLFLWFDF